MSFFTFPLEAFAETFLAEGALTLPTVGESLAGVASVGSVVAGAALPSLIKSTMGGKKREPESFQQGSHKHRRIHDLSAIATPASLSNSSAMGDMEVPVMPHGRVAKTAPDYFTIHLPYSVILTYAAPLLSTGNILRDIRLNSIFDPDASSGTAKQPMGRDTWAGIYKYYRVLKCHVVFTIQNQSNIVETANDKNMLLIGTETTDDVTPVGITQSSSSFMESKNSMAKLLPGRDNTSANMIRMAYTFSPETWDDHVTEAGLDQRWTAVGSDPTIKHRLLLRCFGMTSASVAATNIIYKMDISYTVQFRELQYTVYKETH